MADLRRQVTDVKRDLALAEAAVVKANEELANRREVEPRTLTPPSPSPSYGHLSMSGSESWPQVCTLLLQLAHIGPLVRYPTPRMNLGQK